MSPNLCAMTDAKGIDGQVSPKLQLLAAKAAPKGRGRAGTSAPAAGVAGIIEQIEPQPEVKGNGHANPQEGADYARSMPEAIARLRGSDFARDWLGNRFVDAFSATRQSQHDQFAKKVPDVELQRFFDLG
mgnify:CR=1 FL=1